MRRIALMLTVAIVMAVMIVASAVPAMAHSQGEEASGDGNDVVAQRNHVNSPLTQAKSEFQVWRSQSR